MTVRSSVVFALAVLVAVGCDKEKTRKAQESIQAATSRLSQEYEQAQVAAQARQIFSAVESRDLGALKKLCLDQGNGEDGQIMSCYYNAFAIENNEGVDAARAFLVEEMAREDIGPARGKAVKALSKYFEAKGSLRTREVAGIILVIALESKYPHAGGMVGTVIAEQLGLLDRSAATQPTTAASG